LQFRLFKPKYFKKRFLGIIMVEAAAGVEPAKRVMITDDK